MKSAKKLEAAIRAAWFDPKMKASESRAAAIALIRARDKEIVEACKKAIEKSDILGCSCPICMKEVNDMFDSVLGTLG